MALSDTNRGGYSAAPTRRLFMVLSPRSLPYASLALSSLLRNANEALSLVLITDSDEDKTVLIELLNQIATAERTQHFQSAVYSDADFNQRAASQFAGYDHLLAFRSGHPCWRKITDPLLLSEAGQEMVILDPDVYFPNRFRFEPTPQTGLLLMWQKPSCLLPFEVVEAAMKAGIALAHHTDIGVAQWRMPVDLEWLDWLIGKLGSPNLPRSMHVESIVWAALAMRIGGGHLDPNIWLCWHRTQPKRLLRKFGMSGPAILRQEPFTKIKCFHGGGEAKWWLSEAEKLGYLKSDSALLETSGQLSFEELTVREFARLQLIRRWARKVGYYSFIS
jgi:hypothetical protein